MDSYTKKILLKIPANTLEFKYSVRINFGAFNE